MNHHLRMLASRQTKGVFSASLNSFQRKFSTKRLVINAFGTDRLGIVSDMAKYVTEFGGNIGESQAARLGGHFSLMMLVSVPDDKVDTLMVRLKDIKDMEATFYTAPTDDFEAKTQIGYSCQFTLTGADHVGIMHKMTSIMSENGLSISKMDTFDEIAPHGGTTLLRIKGIAHAYKPMAAGFDASKIKSKLSNLGDDMNCDISMEELVEDDSIAA